MKQNTGIPDYEACPAEHDRWATEFAASLGMTLDEWRYLGLCASAAGDDDELAIRLAIDPTLRAIAADDSDGPDEDRDPAMWRRRALAAHHADMAKLPKPRAKAPARKPVTTRPTTARREHRTQKTQTGQDPGDGDGPADPVQQRINDLVETWPPFSPGQSARLAQLLGGGSK